MATALGAESGIPPVETCVGEDPLRPLTEKTAPLWVTVIGVISVIGMGLGFGCLVLVFLLAALRGRRNKTVVVDEE